MKLFLVTKHGNVVQNEVHTMVLSARNAEEAEKLAREWTSPNKIGFCDAKLIVTEIELNKPQIILVQSL